MRSARTAGLAVQLGRFAAQHSYLVHVTFRRTVVPLTIVTFGLAAAASAWPRWQEHRAIARLAAALRRQQAEGGASSAGTAFGSNA